MRNVYSFMWIFFSKFILNMLHFYDNMEWYNITNAECMFCIQKLKNYSLVLLEIILHKNRNKLFRHTLPEQTNIFPKTNDSNIFIICRVERYNCVHHLYILWRRHTLQYCVDIGKRRRQPTTITYHYMSSRKSCIQFPCLFRFSFSCFFEQNIKQKLFFLFLKSFFISPNEHRKYKFIFLYGKYFR